MYSCMGPVNFQKMAAHENDENWVGVGAGVNPKD